MSFILLFIFFITLVRQLEQQLKFILDSIGNDEKRKRELIRGNAVDKAEQLSKLVSIFNNTKNPFCLTTINVTSKLCPLHPIASWV